MANSEQLEVLRRGAPRWNEWVRSNGASKPDLSGANLNATILVEANLRGVDLSGSRLIKTNLTRSDLRGANLSAANLFEANVAGVDFRGANLAGADFKNSNLVGSIFHDADLSHAKLVTPTVGDANLSGANLTAADLTGADFAGRDLSGAVFESADLSAVNFAQAVLRKASFARTKLARRNLRKADLRGANLAGADLTCADLMEANLENACLDGAVLRDANLVGARLRGASLRGVEFENADLTDADLTDAGLQDANLTAVAGLSARQLVSTDLSGAALPEVLTEFPGLAAAQRAAGVTAKFFLAVLVFAVYLVLLVVATTDAALLANRPPAPLAIFGSGIPILGFFLIAPVLLVGLFAMMHLSSARLWVHLAGLPAVFPNGKRVDAVVKAGLLKWILIWRRPRLCDPRPSMLPAFYCAAAFGYWGIVPTALLLTWFRCLVCQELVWSLWHLMLFLGSVVIAYVSRGTTEDALSGRRTPFTVEGLRISPLRLAAGGALMLVLSLFSLSAVSDSVAGQQWTSRLVRPDFTERDVSVKLAGWDGSNLELVNGAQMARRNLNRLFAPGAFLAKADLSFALMIRSDLPRADLRAASLSNADLRESRLTGANLESANLDAADLSGVNLEGAIIRKADIRGARLFSANLRDADLAGADLRGAKLNAADLTGAKLTGANLTGTNFYEVVLVRTDLRGVDLTGAEQLAPKQLERAYGDETTRLPAGMPRPALWRGSDQS